MGSYLWYYFWVLLLTVANLGGLTATMFALPGNWAIVGFTALFAWLVHDPAGGGVSWWVVGAILVLAIVGEIVEFAAGAAGAARSGGSRRGMVLAMAGAMAGSILGVSVISFVIPIPVVGTVIGAIGGGAFGAFGGAYLGEAWKGREEEHRFAVGKAALLGRLFGTVGKLGIGAMMFVIAAADSLI